MSPVSTEPALGQVNDDKALIFTMRELGQQTARIMSQIEKTGEPAIVTRHGRFIALSGRSRPGRSNRGFSPRWPASSQAGRGLPAASAGAVPARPALRHERRGAHKAGSDGGVRQLGCLDASSSGSSQSATARLSCHGGSGCLEHVIVEPACECRRDRGVVDMDVEHVVAGTGRPFRPVRARRAAEDLGEHVRPLDPEVEPLRERAVGHR